MPCGSRTSIHPAFGLGLLVLAVGTVLLPMPASAQGTPSRPLTFDQSAQILVQQSDTLNGAQASIRAAENTVDSLEGLRLPIVSFDVQAMYYQNTFSASLSGMKGRALGAANNRLAAIKAGGVPGVSGSAVSSVINEVQAALPGMFAPIPDAVGLRIRDSVIHPTLTAILPLYMGGAIPAARAGAAAGLDLATAKAAHARDALQFALVKAYFGQVLAAQVLAVAQATRDGFQLHLENARKLEAQGQISHARVLQVTVARDSAQRALEQAQSQYRTATITLSTLLRSKRMIEPLSPLFVNSTPLQPVDYFIGAAHANHPLLHEADAVADSARQAVKLAHAKLLPKLYAFGRYNLNQDDGLGIAPDWVVGIGLHYTFLSNVDRSDQESAARARADAARAAQRQAWTDIRTAIIKAWHLTESTRRRFLSMKSSITAATESLRVQQLSFRAGMATASDVIDARNALSQARMDRATTAYKYDLALASLLLASSRSAQFPSYLQRADRRLAMP